MIDIMLRQAGFDSRTATRCGREGSVEIGDIVQCACSNKPFVGRFYKFLFADVAFRI